MFLITSAFNYIPEVYLQYVCVTCFLFAVFFHSSVVLHTPIFPLITTVEIENVSLSLISCPDLSRSSGAHAGHRGIHPHRWIGHERFPQCLFDDWELG